MKRPVTFVVILPPRQVCGGFLCELCVLCEKTRSSFSRQDRQVILILTPRGRLSKVSDGLFFNPEGSEALRETLTFYLSHVFALRTLRALRENMPSSLSP
jgi:hypothetical protein